MRAPLSWLRDFAPIEGRPAELASALSNLGLVVEGVEQVGGSFDGIVVARVVDLRRHPDADKVQLVDVDDGHGEPSQIVCGAWNIAVGDLVPLATLGTVMPNGMEIGRRKMRGQWSNGMLCSASELELPDQDGEKGILILPSGVAAPGTPLKEALGLEPDVVFDLDITPNRPDALSIAGVARDLAAALHVPFALPEPSTAVDPSVERAEVVVTAPDLCPRLTATVVTGISIGPSPDWLVRRLTLAGMRAINNVVDASNYVMLELGQPNHAYDIDRLPGRGLLVRRARVGETLVTLDGVERTMTAEDCLICDANSVPVGIAGIMGGASSEISDATTAVLLEAAYFTPMAIARTGKRLGLHTEARARFERGTDPEIIDLAIDRFVSLLGGARTDATPSADSGRPETAPRAVDARPETAPPAGGIRRGPTTDVPSAEYTPVARTVTVRTERVNAILGTALTDADIAELLAPIGFTAVPAGPGLHQVTIPTWRPDSEREIDVIEEVARLHGYRHIGRTLPPGIRTGGGLNPYQRERRRVRDVLAGAGLTEAWTTTFLAPGDLERAGLPPDAVEVENPLDRSESLLRTSLLPGLLKTIRFNTDRQVTDVRLFELGHTFRPPVDGSVLPGEREDLAAIVSGQGADARLAARMWAVLADALRVECIGLEAARLPGYHATRAARIIGVDGTVLGAVGEVDPSVSAAYGVAGRVGFFEVSLEALLASSRRDNQARPVSRYPASDYDLAFVVDDTVPAASVEATLGEEGGDLLEWIRLFDVYRGLQLGSGRRSLAYHLRLRALDRTLTDAEVAEVRQRQIDAVAKAHGGELRQ
jgi:phenylalanyl-tRNA synthetase beta chain